MTSRTDKRIGFLGAGRMATALARGLVCSGFADAASLIASDVMADARSRFEEQRLSRNPMCSSSRSSHSSCRHS
jgi:pyrroline-5-carboxylate reductase